MALRHGIKIVLLTVCILIERRLALGLQGQNELLFVVKYCTQILSKQSLIHDSIAAHLKFEKNLVKFI